jgi:hypothetical protein
VALTLAGDSAITRESLGKFPHRWVDNVRSDIGGLRRSGIRPVLLDGPVGARVLPFWVKPGADDASDVLPVFITDLRFDEISDQTFRLGKDGHLRRVTFRPTVGGTARELAGRGLLTVSGARPEARGKGLCVSATREWASVEFIPTRVLRGRREWYLRSTYRTSPGGAMPLEVNRGVSYPQPWDRGLPPQPVGGTVLTRLGSLPRGRPTLGRFRVDVLPDRWACFERFVVGSYVPRSR